MSAVYNNNQIKELGNTLLKIGSLLMSSGANSRRIRTTVERISEAFNCSVELLITHRALMISVYDSDENQFHSNLKRTSPHGVNFKIVSGISKMSWKIVEERWNIEQINNELNRLISLPHYPRFVILTMVSLAGSSFCRLFGGTIMDMSVAFLATFIGLFIRQESIKQKFNPYLCVFFASFTSSIIASAFVKYAGSIQEYALSTSVLYLIPGVPLINSFSDLIDGNIMNGIVRSINGLIIAFSIALGLLLAMQIFQI
ncbi:MAG: threonine/serine exporter family protein [Marinilabiliaceae bacterium]|nr:threonine/serine exporter family protein [Marinilabiliaceae bacterium]